MSRRIRQITVLAFALFLISPALLYAVQGPAEGFIFGKPQPAWPAVESLVESDPAGRSVFVEALLDRSALRREVIRLRNLFSLDVLGYVDNELVVSGARGWLFYKPSLTVWACSHHELMEGGLERLRLLVELAEANAIPLLIAVVPNKASIATEHASGRAKAYMPCYSDMERQVRDVLRSHASPHLIDHADAFYSDVDGRQSYLKMDTHWNRLSAFLGIAQLAARIRGAASPVAEPEVEPFDRQTDLGNLFLLRSALEKSEIVVSNVTASAAQVDFAAESTFILHDSFYVEGGDFLRAWLPGADMRMIGLPEAQEVDLEGARLVVFESVERLLLARLRDPDSAGWRSPLGRWIRNGMQVAASTCDWDSAESLLADVDPDGLSIDEAGRVRTFANVSSLTVSLPDSMPPGAASSLCLELEIGLDEGTQAPPDVRVQIGLGNDHRSLEGEATSFVHGRDIALDFESGRGRLALRLPESARGANLRIDLISEPAEFMLRALRVAPGGTHLPTPPILRDGIASRGLATEISRKSSDRMRPR